MNQRADNVSDDNRRISLSLFTLSLCHVSLTTVLLSAALAPCEADPRAGYSLAPMENLEHVDVALIDRAEHEIDLAADVLTDWPTPPVTAFKSIHILTALSLPSASSRKSSTTSLKRPASSFCRLA